jgi:hypothetical protein
MNMKKIFNIKKGLSIMLILSVIVSIFGCQKDFLDRQTQGEYNETNYPYPEGSGPYDQFIFGIYDQLRKYDVTVMPFVAATSIRSDDADKGSTPSDGADALQMDNFTLTPTNGMLNGLWTGHYTLIDRANFVLDKVDNDSTIVADEAIKNVARAEARLLRGYGYFMLVRLFGRVPIIKSVITVSVGEANIPQSSAAEVYNFIEQDLNFAAGILPPSYDARFSGRVTSGVANGLLAKVYITQGKFAEAMAAANRVMTSGQYDLSVPYTRIFNEEGENSKETVFEVQATATASEPTDKFGSQYASVQGVRGTGSWDLGWGFNTPSTSLEAAYEPGDPRRERTILYTGGVSLYGEAIPAGLTNPRYNNKVYTNPAKRASIGNRFGWWTNVRLLRYADVVLMYAEAANEIGGEENIDKVLTALNSVRARARGGNTAILPNVTTRDQGLLREAIRHERRVELGMEHERFFDLVRWGIAGEVLRDHGKAFIDNKHELLPIPQTQIDLSRGLLTQNNY